MIVIRPFASSLVLVLLVAPDSIVSDCWIFPPLALMGTIFLTAEPRLEPESICITLPLRAYCCARLQYTKRGVSQLLLLRSAVCVSLTWRSCNFMQQYDWLSLSLAFHVVCQNTDGTIFTEVASTKCLNSVEEKLFCNRAMVLKLWYVPCSGTFCWRRLIQKNVSRQNTGR